MTDFIAAVRKSVHAGAVNAAKAFAKEVEAIAAAYKAVPDTLPAIRQAHKLAYVAARLGLPNNAAAIGEVTKTLASTPRKAQPKPMQDILNAEAVAWSARSIAAGIPAATKAGKPRDESKADKPAKGKGEQAPKMTKTAAPAAPAKPAPITAPALITREECLAYVASMAAQMLTAQKRNAKPFGAELASAVKDFADRIKALSEKG